MRRSLVIFALCVTASTAYAQTQAEKLFAEAVQLRQAGKVDEACLVFRKSYALSREPGTGLNVAECEEREKHRVKAWHIYQESIASYDDQGNAAGARAARESATALAAKLGTVVIGGVDPELEGLTISIDGRTIQPAAEIREVVEPGEVSITATATGRAPFERSRAIGAGETMVVELELRAVPGGGGHVDRVTTRSDLTERRPSRVHLAIGLGLAGVVVGGVGAGIIWKARSNYSDGVAAGCDKADPPNCPDDPVYNRVLAAVKLERRGWGVVAVGGVFALAGVIIYATAPRDAIRITPVSTADSIGLSLSRTF